MEIEINYEQIRAGMEIIKALDMHYLEEWKLIDGFQNYSISSYGRVRNDKTERILRAGITDHGYFIVNLYKDKKRKSMKVHKLVTNAFIDNPEGKRCVDHINNDRLDNRITNLRYATDNENQHNRVLNKNNSSGIKGVYFNKQTKKWQAQISIDGIRIHMGCFDNIEEATQARIERANEAFGIYVNQCEQ